ncbi:hypothetical protein BV25DRAFT_1922141 [Artomyces pyxidatus]|uniref:Uncharacterized protein n=1 Tax=Artomyces pyxidatus TaxID=48021 RepID=A0ACB8SG81_9AGAM|nr:hypothetical protein BV25DRAFT_1922141 [Artomyces pyxidatus]
MTDWDSAALGAVGRGVLPELRPSTAASSGKAQLRLTVVELTRPSVFLNTPKTRATSPAVVGILGRSLERNVLRLRGRHVADAVPASERHNIHRDDSLPAQKHDAHYWRQRYKVLKARTLSLQEENEDILVDNLRLEQLAEHARQKLRRAVRGHIAVIAALRANGIEASLIYRENKEELSGKGEGYKAPGDSGEDRSANDEDMSLEDGDDVRLGEEEEDMGLRQYVEGMDPGEE